MREVEIVEATGDEIPIAANVASHAMIGLPEVEPVLRGRRDRMEAMFNLMLRKLAGHVYVAKDAGEIIGVMRVVAWPACKPTPLQMLPNLPALVMAMGGATLRGAKFQAIWAKQDPQKPHLHLDPLAVKVGRQGQGIGGQLMKFYCRQLDEQRIGGYLETGTKDNVRFYERHGFTVTSEVPVFGVPTYMMWRDPAEA